MTTTSPEEVTIRQAERADLLSVFRIERASFPQPWPFSAFEGFLGEPGFLVAEAPDGAREGRDGERSEGTDDPESGIAALDSGDDLAGYVIADVVDSYGAPVGHVKDLAVAPGWRGRGIGSSLLSRALSTLSAGGARQAKLEVRESNEGAIDLYRRFGFSTHRALSGYYEDGEDALLLLADLDGRDSPDRGPADG